MNVLVKIFVMYGLAANVSKSHTMACHTSALQAGMLEEAMALKCTEVGDSYQVRLLWRIPCIECGVGLIMGSMTTHFHHMQGIVPAIELSRRPFSQTVQQPQV